MSQYQIAVVVGSLRKDSYNRALAGALAKLAPPEFTFRQVEIGDLRAGAFRTAIDKIATLGAAGGASLHHGGPPA